MVRPGHHRDGVDLGVADLVERLLHPRQGGPELAFARESLVFEREAPQAP